MNENNINIKDIFYDKSFVKEIKEKLPKLFRIAEIESSRAGKIGMEVGSIREKIIIALLIHKFGEENVDSNLPITEPETDVILNKNEISIKTITGSISGVKAIWTVDANKAKYFVDNYSPKCDIILIQICWGTNDGGFFLIPLSVQKEIFKKLGKEAYLKLPKVGTNPRGVEYSKEALGKMVEHKDTLKIKIKWDKEDVDYNIYERWIDYWSGKEELN